MGNKKSKPLPLLLDKPWQQINWGGREADLQFIRSYRPQSDDVQQLRILLHRPVGTGKSSFINSVSSIFQDRICTCAVANNSEKDCFTKKYQTYKIKSRNDGTFYPIVLNDMMGLKTASRRSKKVHVKDVKKALKGHIKDGYTFNPECSLSKDNIQFYNDAPNGNDKVHIVVCVIDANKEQLLSNDFVETIQDIRDEASDLGIPQVAIFTKIDEACPEVKKNIKNVEKSKLIQERVQHFSALVGIPENCIFPVKNYHSEKTLNNETDVLILSTLRRIIEISDEFLHKQGEQNPNNPIEVI